MEMNIWINRVWNFENQTGIWRNYCMELNFGAEEYIEGEMPKYIEDIYGNNKAIPDGVVVAIDVSDPLKEMADATMLFDDKNVWLLFLSGDNVVIEKIETDMSDKYFLRAVKEFLEEVKVGFENKAKQIQDELSLIEKEIQKDEQ